MNKNQKQILKKFYDAYLTGEDSLRKAIKERIDMLEKDTNWKRELVDPSSEIYSGYIPKGKGLYLLDVDTIEFDDDEIYYLFLTNLFGNKFNLNGKVYNLIKESLLKTSIQYFGETKIDNFTRIQREETYINDNMNKLSNFKNKGVAFCLEKALFVQNIMSLIGIKSYYISNIIRIDGDEWGRHAYNIINYDGKVRLMDIMAGKAYTYKNGNCIKEDIWDTGLYLNDIHRIAKCQTIEVKIWDKYKYVNGKVKYKPTIIHYGNIGNEEKLFRKSLRYRTIDKEVDNEFLNKVIGSKRNLMKEKEIFGANTIMAYLILPIDIVDNFDTYNYLKYLVINKGDIQAYLNYVYIKAVNPNARNSSNMPQFNIEYIVKDINYKGKATKMLILKLPMSDRRKYKFETIYTAIIFDDTFPRVFNLTYGYPTQEKESKDVVLHEVLNRMHFPIEPLKDTTIDTFAQRIQQEIDNDECILERSLDTYIDEFFDMKCSAYTYKLALDIYNKGLMRSDFTQSKNKVKYYTKISCNKCNLYCKEIDEFPTAYVKEEYMGYTNIYSGNINCEFIRINMVCPFRLLCYIERLLLNTKITPDKILNKLIQIQMKRENNDENTVESK